MCSRRHLSKNYTELGTLAKIMIPAVSEEFEYPNNCKKSQVSLRNPEALNPGRSSPQALTQTPGGSKNRTPQVVPSTSTTIGSFSATLTGIYSGSSQGSGELQFPHPSSWTRTPCTLRDGLEWVLGLRFWGLGFWAFRVCGWGFGFRVWGLGVRMV